MKIVSVVGARPQFIKAWPVSQALQSAGIEEALVHSGQHYDDAMSRVFFQELSLAAPARNLGVGSGSHGEQTGRIMIELERTVIEIAPDAVLVYGDTNTTLAAAVVACKLRIPVAHVEAGLRSWNRAMPEEHNRVLTDHCSDLLFCPTSTALENLAREGLTKGAHLVGDVMYDAVLHFGARARECSAVLRELGLEAGEYVLATIHRPQNADDPTRLGAIIESLQSLDAPVVFPVHPRTRARLDAQLLPSGSRSTGALRLVEPCGYLDMLMLEQSARAILTDSGGVQKEAYFFGVPCVTLRAETEWVETVRAGWNILAPDPAEAVRAVARIRPPQQVASNPFGNGTAAVQIAELLSRELR